MKEKKLQTVNWQKKEETRLTLKGAHKLQKKVNVA